MRAPRWVERSYFRLESARIDAVYFAQVGATYLLGFVAKTLRLVGIEIPITAFVGVLRWILTWNE